jgi:ribosomal 50S subunit-recycling heat shock protein
MRLDLFLRASRLAVRRTLAQELCEAGAVLVNGVAARSSREVRAGDEITLKRARSILTVRVLTIPSAKQVSKSGAASLYEILNSENLETDDPFAV